jgi:hypothetical protein
MIDTEKYQPARQNMKFAHSPPNFIFQLGRLIFSVSINSHPDNIYLLSTEKQYSAAANIAFGAP